jgi:hypothetical protein
MSLTAGARLGPYEIVAPLDQSPELGVPQVLFQTGGLGREQYVVSRDGTRFLVPVRSEGRQGDVPLSVVLNWPTLFVRK